MASGFSLGAAIGATGKFPKLKTAEIDSGASDRQARELAAVRSRVTADNTKYHNVFINENKDETTKFIVSMIQSEKMKDPEVVSKIYTGESDLIAKRNEYLLASKYFFDLENKIEDAKNQKTVEYVSPSMETLYEALKESKSKEELYDRYIKNPEMFADGYVTMEKLPDGYVVPKVNFHNKYDFPTLFSKGSKVFNLSEKGVVITETTTTTKEGRQVDRYISIPKDRQEALELKKTNPNVKVEANAFDLGKEWFVKEPDAQKQYRSQLANDGKPDALDPYAMTFDQLYDQLYKESILPNIPAKYENKDALFTRTIVNVTNTTEKTAPTDFVVGTMTSNYMTNADNTPGSFTSELSAPVADDPEGKAVQIPSNQFIINMDGKPGFINDTTQKTMKISRIAILAAIQKEDATTKKKYLRPMTDEERASYDAAGKKYLMYPFAFGNLQELSVAAVPQLGAETYIIPLFEPDRSGRWVVPNVARNGSSKKGSLILSQITKRDWDPQTQKNWNKAFFEMMGGVVDQNDVTR